MKLLLALVLTASSAFADTSVGPVTYNSAPLKRVNTTVATINPASQQACIDRAVIDSESRSATANYTCGNFIFTVTWSPAPVVCPGTSPADTSKTISCSSPYFGTRQVTQAWTLHSTPTCWVNDGPINPLLDTVPPCTTTPPSGSYTTVFSVQENPLSEGSVWNHVDNGTWTKVAIGPNGAHGTQVSPRAKDYTDSYAYLSGFSANQSAQGTVYKKSGNLAVSYREVELLLRWSDQQGRATGYEVNFAYLGNYVQIQRWDGAYGNFVGPLCNNTLPSAPATGTLLKATMVGNLITVYMNGTVVCTATDNTYTSGNPGIGFYIDPSYGVPNDEYGFRDFTATQLP